MTGVKPYYRNNPRVLRGMGKEDHNLYILNYIPPAHMYQYMYIYMYICMRVYIYIKTSVTKLWMRKSKGKFYKTKSQRQDWYLCLERGINFYCFIVNINFIQHCIQKQLPLSVEIYLLFHY